MKLLFRNYTVVNKTSNLHFEDINLMRIKNPDPLEERDFQYLLILNYPK